MNADDALTAEEFTRLSIVPTLDDILYDCEQFLRPNVVKGPYTSVHHFLDVHFRLLREDFLQPLRKGVRDLKKIVAHPKYGKANTQRMAEMNHRIKKIESLSVYFNVRTKSCEASAMGVCYAMQLDEEQIRKINWETSKRLIFGSLVCFSSDYFANDCLVGVICDQNERRISQTGEIFVKFDQGGRNMGRVPAFNKSYVMLESSAFFEAYRHVLDALVSFSHSPEASFPFRENFIECQNKEIPLPKYVTNTVFDFGYII
jgi:hypothetical protein